MEATSIAGKESYLTEGGMEGAGRERGKWAEGAREAPCHNLPIGNHHRRSACAAGAAGNIYGRSFVIGGGFTYSQTSARHTQDKRARARMRMEEAQYCRGARYVRKSRIATRAAVREEERGMRVLLDITYSPDLSR